MAITWYYCMFSQEIQKNLILCVTPKSHFCEFVSSLCSSLLAAGIFALHVALHRFSAWWFTELRLAGRAGLAASSGAAWGTLRGGRRDRSLLLDLGCSPLPGPCCKPLAKPLPRSPSPIAAYACCVWIYDIQDNGVLPLFASRIQNCQLYFHDVLTWYTVACTIRVMIMDIIKIIHRYYYSTLRTSPSNLHLSLKPQNTNNFI